MQQPPSRFPAMWATFMTWVDRRFPATETFELHLSKYAAPKNFNFWYFFGSIAVVVLVMQLLTGIWLTMSYVPSGDGAFASVEYIMRDVEFGWLLRYLHTTGASAFFIVVYLHMFRGLMYGSYREPRELLWLIGMAIFVSMMAEGFFGYLLPWGNMSYWAAQVIVSLFSAIPVIGADLMEWIRGDYLVSEVTLNRFFALHVVALPLVLVMLWPSRAVCAPPVLRSRDARAGRVRSRARWRSTPRAVGVARRLSPWTTWTRTIADPLGLPATQPAPAR